ncbi:MAG: DUF3413 domain-containing protein [Gammaproteobacteria bacterium]|nr:DUF3413 domain-containing protein [Gammaproteobacteria bacterium]
MKTSLSNISSPQEITSRLVSWGHWFSFANSLGAALFGMLYLLFNQSQTTIASLCFNIIYGLGHFAVLTFIAYLILLFPLAFVVRHPRSYLIIGALLAAAAWTMLALDLLLFAKHGLHLAQYMWAILLEDAKGLTAAPGWSYLAFFSLMLAIQWPLAFALWRRRTLPHRHRIARRLAATLVLFFLCGHLAYIAADAIGYGPIIAKRELYPLSYPTTARNLLSDYGVNLDQRVEGQQQLRLAISMELEQQPLQLATKSDLVVVVIDGLRNDLPLDQLMPATLAWRPVRSISNHHYASGNNATDSLYGLLHGVPPTYRKPLSKVTDKAPLLQLLADSGYRGHYFGNADRDTRDMLQRSGLASAKIADPALTLSDADAQAVASALDWWQANGDVPRLLLLHLTAPSQLAYPASFVGPYQPIFEGVFLNGNNTDRNKVINRYYNSIKYSDQLLAPLLATISTSSPNATLVVTSSFALGLNEQQDGRWGITHQLSRDQLQVPLLISGPVAAQLRQDPNLTTSHYDLLPTLAAAGGVSLPLDADGKLPLAGRSLLTNSTELPRNWLLVGNRNHFALIETERTTEFRHGRQPQVYDMRGRVIDDGPSGKAFSRAYKEMRRYLAPPAESQ